MMAQNNQYIQAFQKFYPNQGINSVLQSTQLYEMLNNMAVTNHNYNYDSETFSELVQRVQQFNSPLTISTYLEAHIQAVDVLSFRVESLRSEIRAIDSFLNQLQNRVQDLNSMNPSNMNHKIHFKTFTLTGQIPDSNLYLRISSDSFQNDNILPFINQGRNLTLQYPSGFEINQLRQSFFLEVIDSSQYTIGQANLNVFQLNITYASKIQLPLTLDSLRNGMTLEIDGFVEITNAQYAQEDYQGVRDQQGQLNMDLTGCQEQLRDLNSPFEGVQRSFRGSHNPSFYNQPPQVQHAGGMGGYNNTSPQYYQDDGYGSNQQYQAKHVDVQGGMRDNHHMYTSNNEDCDFNAKSLVSNIHYLLAIYIVVAVLFCVKRSMFLDVTIGISFFTIIYKFDLTSYPKSPEYLKLFIGLFVVSASLDLAWLIVFFPSWNRDLTSEDEGAQGVLRIILLGASLLFMIYKVLLIVAVVLINRDLLNNGYSAHKAAETFLSGADFQSRTSHQTANPKTIH